MLTRPQRTTRRRPRHRSLLLWPCCPPTTRRASSAPVSPGPKWPGRRPATPRRWTRPSWPPVRPVGRGRLWSSPMGRRCCGPRRGASRCWRSVPTRLCWRRLSRRLWPRCAPPSSARAPLPRVARSSSSTSTAATCWPLRPLRGFRAPGSCASPTASASMRARSKATSPKKEGPLRLSPTRRPCDSGCGPPDDTQPFRVSTR